jgi:putative transposase
MKTLRFTDSQIMAILKKTKAGSSVPELCREHGIDSASFCKWRTEFGGMDASLMKRIKRDKPEALSVPSAINQACSMDFMSNFLKDGRSVRTFNVIDDLIGNA